MRRNHKRVGRIQVVLHRVQVPILEFHVSNIVLHLDHIFSDIDRHETVRSCKGLARDGPAHNKHEWREEILEA